MMRYVYVKNGDAVDQVARWQKADRGPTSGPDAFLVSFLTAVEGSAVLLLSRDRRETRLVAGEVDARVYGWSTGARFTALRKAWALVRMAWQIVRYRPDRILCGCIGPTLWVTALAALVSGRGYVHSRHNALSGRGPGAMLDRLCIRAARGVVCHGPFLRDDTRRMGVAPQRIGEFDIDLGDLVEAPGSPSGGAAGEAGYTFLFIGRLEEEKGVFELLRAALDVLGRHPRLKLVFAGSGGAERALEAEIRRRQASDRVTLLGRVERDALGMWIGRSLAVVTPTRRMFPEGRCMVAMEALVMGCPVVAPEFGPFPYLVRHEQNGLLYEPDDEAALRDALERLASEPGLTARLATGARASGREIVHPPQSFGEAVLQAFEPGDGERGTSPVTAKGTWGSR